MLLERALYIIPGTSQCSNNEVWEREARAFFLVPQGRTICVDNKVDPRGY